jgi:hypothetical protein
MRVSTRPRPCISRELLRSPSSSPSVLPSSAVRSGRAHRPSAGRGNCDSPHLRSSPPRRARSRRAPRPGLRDVHSGRPARGGPRGVEVRRPGGERQAVRRSRPPRPGACGRLRPPVRRAMYRRAADLRARADRAAATRCWLTGEPSAVRVRGGGGGRARGPRPSRPGSRVGEVHGVERCLAQRRELECRSHGTAHQLAERARGRATCRQRGEHVFEKGRGGVGRNGRRRGAGNAPIRLWRAEKPRLNCNRTCTGSLAS